MTRSLAALAGAVLAVAGAAAAEWPNKPVRIVVPFAAGGAADTFGRLYADALSAPLVGNSTSRTGAAAAG